MIAIYTVPPASVTPDWGITIAQWLHGPDAGTKACTICGTRFAIPKRNRGKLFCGRKCASVSEYRQRRERLAEERATSEPEAQTSE